MPPRLGKYNDKRSPKVVFNPRCHEVEHRRKVRITLVDCLSEASFLERRTLREAQKSPKDRVAGPLPVNLNLRLGLREAIKKRHNPYREAPPTSTGKPPRPLVGGFTGRPFFWFVLFAFGKLKSRAFHALFVFPFQGQEKTKPSRKRDECLLPLGEQRK
jgi:hypothetical protein